MGKSCSLQQIAALLWYAARVQRIWPSGRAGIPWEWRAAPSAGGLHPIEIVCIPSAVGLGVKLYDPRRHAFHELDISVTRVIAANKRSIEAILGSSRGITLQFLADFSKTNAGYKNAASLVMRDAGCLLAVLCLCAEWLGFAACPVGRLGTEYVRLLGFPANRYVGVGAVQIGALPRAQ
jgi:SagB-type dehydrogenase family enzyme